MPSDPSSPVFFLPLCVWNCIEAEAGGHVSWALLCASPGVPPSGASLQFPFTCIRAAHVDYLPLCACVSAILTQMLLPGLGDPPPQELCNLSSFHSVPSTLYPSRLHLATSQMKKLRHGSVRQVLNPQQNVGSVGMAQLLYYMPKLRFPPLHMPVTWGRSWFTVCAYSQWCLWPFQVLLFLHGPGE